MAVQIVPNLQAFPLPARTCPPSSSNPNLPRHLLGLLSPLLLAPPPPLRRLQAPPHHTQEMLILQSSSHTLLVVELLVDAILRLMRPGTDGNVDFVRGGEGVQEPDTEGETCRGRERAGGREQQDDSGSLSVSRSRKRRNKSHLAVLTDKRGHGAVWNRRCELHAHSGISGRSGIVVWVRDGDVGGIDDGQLLEGERMLRVVDRSDQV